MYNARAVLGLLHKHGFFTTNREFLEVVIPVGVSTVFDRRLTLLLQDDRLTIYYGFRDTTVYGWATARKEMTIERFREIWSSVC